MVRLYKKSDYYNLIEFINDYGDKNLYITKDNNRFFSDNPYFLSNFLKVIQNLYILEEGPKILGLIAIWKANTNRRYIKFSARNNYEVYKLLTVLLWNHNYDLFVKIAKNSDCIYSFKKKGFRFFRPRGKELLLRRLKDERNLNKYRDKSKVYNRRQ